MAHVIYGFKHEDGGIKCAAHYILFDPKPGENPRQTVVSDSASIAMRLYSEDPTIEEFYIVDNSFGLKNYFRSMHSPVSMEKNYEFYNFVKSTGYSIPMSRVKGGIRYAVYA